MEVKTIQKVRKVGNAHVVTIPAAFINGGMLAIGEDIEIVLRKPESLVEEPVGSQFNAPARSETPVDVDLLPWPQRNATRAGGLS